MAGGKNLLGRFRRVKFPSRWLRRIRWWYWYHADEWPLWALRQCGKASFILLLWILIAVGLFWLLRSLLPEIGEGTEGVSKESIALLGSLLTVLIGFGLQQWKSQEDMERRRQEEENGALSQIDGFCGLLRRDLSEAARCYVDFRRKGGVWQSSKVRARREEAWEKEAPQELRCAVSVMEKLPEREGFDRSEQVNALLWAFGHLDEDWQSRAANALFDLGGAFSEWTEKALRAILGVWPEVTLGRGHISIPVPSILSGLHHLGLNVNPFGSERAEEDAYLLKTRATPSWWEQVNFPTPGLFFTAPGGGRTAAAILLAYDALFERTAFPVYCRIAMTRLRVDDLAAWTAKAIARYISLFPLSFTECPSSTKTAIKRLLSRYLSVDPLLYLQQAGLPSVGEGGKVVEEFRAYLAGPLSPLLSQPDLLTLLSQSHPADFPRVLILADVQGVLGDESALLYFYALSDLLAQVGVILQVFLAVSSFDDGLQGFGKSLEWSDSDLRDLLRRRLRLSSSDDTLDTWCDLRMWGVSSVEDRLISAAGHNPRRLICLGNALLRRIGERAQRLKPQDVDEVLAKVQ